MPGIGRSHPAWLLVAVQRERVGRQVVAPERGLEPLAQRVRLLREGRGSYRVVQRRGQRRCVSLGAINVGLNLAKSDRTFGQAAILVEDGVVRILPALIDQPLGILALIFYKPVTVRVAIGVDPMEGSLNIRP